jgi:hypothetical protein
MNITIRATERLKGNKPLDVGPTLSSLLKAVPGSPVDPSRLRVMADWIQYKTNFRNPVDLRPILPSALGLRRGEEAGGSGYELAVDLRRAGSVDMEAEATRLLAANSHASGDVVYLEEWVPLSQSCVWAFNALYWGSLSLWEESTGRGYEQALPGGESDARNVAAARDLILELFGVWDRLAERHALPEELHVLELGVGNGNQAKVWLDEFLRLDREMDRGYYRRLHYLMGDYSSHVLQLARQNVAEHAEHTSGLVLDATKPTQTLGFLRYKAFLVYISNVYDNLPTDELVRVDGHLYRVQTRAYLPSTAVAEIAELTGLAAQDVPEMVLRLLKVGPQLLSDALPRRFPTPLDAVKLWRSAWDALRLEDRYVPMEELDTYEVAPGISGEVLRPIVESNGDVRMHVSNGAVASFADTLPLLHPHGMLQCHDLFITDIHQYATSFRGPGKYDGSVVNWVNGPILAAVGSRRGFDVTFASFAHRSGANVLTLTARVRE